MSQAFRSAYRSAYRSAFRFHRRPSTRSTSAPFERTFKFSNRNVNTMTTAEKHRQDSDPDFEISAGKSVSSSSSDASLVDSPRSEDEVRVLDDDDPSGSDVDARTSSWGSQKRKNPFAKKKGGANKRLTNRASAPGSRASQETTLASQPPPKDIEDVLFSPSELPVMQNALLNWYDKNHRVLPWRRNAHSKLSPAVVASQPYQAPGNDLEDDVFIYYVWVCEIMSQQTQVSRVCEYFTKWVKKWPTVVDLARATQEEVNDMWAGLGYYRRAKYLLDGAKYVVSNLGGVFPQSADALKKIPGVGPYTSRAISSQACGEPVAVVDGNVIRVFSRLRRIGGDPKSGQMVKMFADLADRTLATERPGDFNQAVMELGAMVCVPNTMPACDTCPVRKWCRAAQAGVVMDYPSKAPKAAKREERVGVSVLRVVEEDGKQGWKDGKFLLLKRPEEGLLAGLWEFPLKSLLTASEQTETLEGAAEEDGKRAAASSDGNASNKTTHSPHLTQRKSREEIMDAYLRDEVGVAVKRVINRTNLGEHLSIFTHIRMTMEVEELCVVLDDKNGGLASLEDSDGVHWVTYDALRERSLTSSVKKCLDAYSSHHINKAKKANGITKFFVKKH
jgi:A/G-specific adenine glycosylase